MNKNPKHIIIGGATIVLGVILTYLGNQQSYSTGAGDDVSKIAGVVLLVGGVAFTGFGFINKDK